MKNKIEDLRDHLFATLEALQDEKNPMSLDCAKVIADVAQVIVNSAKVEVDFIRAVEGEKGTPFLDPSNRKELPSATVSKIAARA